MAFCINCGQELAEGAKFCAGCGTAVPAVQRKTVFDGEIHKCPNCGEVLESFVAVCPACGCEFRGTSTTNAGQEFVAKIDAAATGYQKETIIRNFPIPNTKEDIFEFMILASSNLIGESNESIFNAWLAKFEQCYQKAKLSFGNDADFSKIQILYEQTTKQVNKTRRMQEANKIGSAVSKFTATFPNPVFSIVAVLLLIYMGIRIFKGDFAGADILMSALILGGTYAITNKKSKK